MRNRQINRRRELELQRIKRIEDLQNNNLQIYHQIQQGHSLSLLQHDSPCPSDTHPHAQCWECDSNSKLSVNKISTIQYTNESGHNCSANDTIGELLSPLALIDNQYLS